MNKIIHVPVRGGGGFAGLGAMDGYLASMYFLFVCVCVLAWNAWSMTCADGWMAYGFHMDFKWMAYGMWISLRLPYCILL